MCICIRMGMRVCEAKTRERKCVCSYMCVRVCKNVRYVCKDSKKSSTVKHYACMYKCLFVLYVCVCICEIEGRREACADAEDS